MNFSVKNLYEQNLKRKKKKHAIHESPVKSLKLSDPTPAPERVYTDAKENQIM